MVINATAEEGVSSSIPGQILDKLLLLHIRYIRNLQIDNPNNTLPSSVLFLKTNTRQSYNKSLSEQLSFRKHSF